MNEKRTAYDWMIAVVLIVMAATFALMLVGCNPDARQQRKAEGKCRNAEALLKEAIELCPDVMQANVVRDTLVVFTDPVASVGERTYSQASVDSLATMCAELLSTYRGQAEDASRQYAELLAQRIVQRACRFKTIVVDSARYGLRIWTEKGKVRYFLNIHSDKVRVPVETSRREFNPDPAVRETPPSRVRSWSWLWSIPALIVGFFLGAFMRGSHRYE